MELGARLLPKDVDETIVHPEELEELEDLPDYDAVREERLRAARTLVFAPLLGAASWLLLGGTAYVVIRLLL